MKKFAILLTALLLLFTVTVLVACNDTTSATDYVRKHLTYDQANPILGVDFPSAPFSSAVNSYMEKDQIELILSNFAELSFSDKKQIDTKTILSFEKGEYGLAVDKEKAPLGFSNDRCGTIYKCIITVYYSDYSQGLIMIDYDGTVYYFNELDQTLCSTKSGAVSADKFYPSSLAPFLK